MSEQLVSILPQFLKGLGGGVNFDSLALWAGGGIVVVMTLVMLPELFYWATMRSVKNRLRELDEKLERMDKRFDRLETLIKTTTQLRVELPEIPSDVPALSTQPGPAKRDASFPLQH